MPSAPISVELHALQATYVERGRTLSVLDDISLTVDSGEIVVVIGPSGSGKSTLLDIVAGLIEPDAGTVQIGDRVLVAEERLGLSAYMRQRDLLLPWRTVRANAALALEARGVARTEARRQADAALEHFRLDRFRDAYPAQLSGGMRQRVAFIRTMLAGRPLLLLDEPFGALDALTRAELHEWLQAALAESPRTVLLVTHDVTEAVLLADRVAVLTARPASVAHIEPVNLPRPRTRASLIEPAAVVAMAAIMAALDGSSPAAPELESA